MVQMACVAFYVRNVFNVSNRFMCSLQPDIVNISCMELITNPWDISIIEVKCNFILVLFVIWLDISFLCLIYGYTRHENTLQM